MARRFPLKIRTRKEQNAYFAKLKKKTKKKPVRKRTARKPVIAKPHVYKPRLYKPPVYKIPSYNPNKSFPKDLKIYVPESSPTLSIPDVDIAIHSTFEKKKKKKEKR